MTNEEKSRELSHDYFIRGQLGFVSPDSESAGYECAMTMCAMTMAQWKDEQYIEEKREILGLVKMLPKNESNQTIIEDLIALLEP